MLETIPLSLDAVRDVAKECFDDGWRLVTMSANQIDDANFDVIYHYDKDLTMKHYRLTVPKETVVPSISPVYFAALLVENEIRDQFGICFSDIVLDFGGALYLEEEVRAMPFCKVSVAQKQS
ncbi:NADH-quinone oxidoreductase subunit C [Solidesulfovibrio alcoholivorans]|uniref:NADH-quinone oxidoreductase subunit C n=1 Tax=Solidesulfovibrio alcoholivorans TaxID=81406 RepID=UPI0004985CC2|nr:NADH-quinone oxidoreductase subunit C [Solidesulfovibrio alcoholivorans]